MSEVGGRGGPARPATRLAVVLLVLGACLIAVHAWFHLTWFGMHGTADALLLWTDLRWDFGPFSWISWLALASVGVVAWRAGAGQRGRELWGWRVTGGLFVYLALDDAFTVHEHLGALVEAAWPALRVYGWVVIVLPAFAVAGLCSFAFLLGKCWSDRARRWQLLAGYCCMGIAVVLEVIERELFRSGLRWRGFLLTDYQQVVEEALELVGPLLLLCCIDRLRAARNATLAP